jgi:hypothetical protein
MNLSTGDFFVCQKNFEKQLENLEIDLVKYWDELEDNER